MGGEGSEVLGRGEGWIWLRNGIEGAGEGVLAIWWALTEWD